MEGPGIDTPGAGGGAEDALTGEDLLPGFACPLGLILS
jgi:hypothetical protein